jgi:plastocyanin
VCARADPRALPADERRNQVRALRALAVVLAATLALAACGGSNEPPAAAPPATTTETTPTEPAQSGGEAAAQVIEVRGGEPVGGVRTIRVNSGDTVRFVVRADAPEEVHVHGYDISKDVGPGEDATFEFTANLEGIFEAELENSSVQIVKLVVEP